jgi:(2Fe-2S) ferredoxin
MESRAPRLQKFLFVCENSREEGKCCMPAGGQIREALKKAVKDSGLDPKLRVSRAGCLDLCAEGPNVLLMPDNRWFSHVGKNDLEDILREARKGLS